MQNNKLKFIAPVLIVILGFAVYSNSLNGQFIWDDEDLIENNVYIKNFSHLPKIFTRNIEAGTGGKTCFYRPLQTLTYMIDYSLWSLNVKGYHLTNILLHILAALSIYWLINLLYQDKLLSLFTGIFFVVWPIHTEAVAYISGRTDPLALLFMLLCFIFYLKYAEQKSVSVFILMILSYSFALLSRETSLVLPVLLLLYHYTFKKKLKAKKFLPILCIAAVYILLRVTVLKSLLSYTSSTTLFQRIPGFFVALTNYIRLLILPFNLHMEYGSKLFKFTHPQAIFGMAFLCLLLLFAFTKRDSKSLIFFSISWFFVALLPVSGLYPLNAYMAEHWLYLPSVGFFLVLARLLCFIYRAEGMRTLKIIFVISLLTFYSYLTIRQNDYWNNPVTFYKKTLKYAPDSPRIYNNLAYTYSAMGNTTEAITLYQKAIALDPDYAEAYNNLGIAYKNIGNTTEAITLYQKAIELNPMYTEAYNNLADAYSTIGKTAEAINLFQKAIAINLACAPAYYNLANTYRTMGRNAEAIALYQKAIALNPLYTKAYNNLADAYSTIGNTTEAITLYQKAIAIEPTCAQAYYNLANTYSAMGRNAEAITLYQKAIALDPDYAEAYNNLSVAYLRQGQYALAMEYYNKAKELGFNNSALSETLKPYRKQEEK